MPATVQRHHQKISIAQPNARSPNNPESDPICVIVLRTPPIIMRRVPHSTDPQGINIMHEKKMADKFFLLGIVMRAALESNVSTLKRGVGGTTGMFPPDSMICRLGNAASYFLAAIDLAVFLRMA
jgi:hypothetical protein